MRQTLYLTLLILLFCMSAQAQEAPEAIPDSLTGWENTLISTLSFNQASYDDWRAGGDNTVAFKLALDGSAKNTTGKISQTHTVQFAYGKSKVGDQEVRKVDDLIRYMFDLVLETGTSVKPVVNIDARSQFDKGYDFSTEPKSLIAQFLAPAYIVETVGIAHDPAEWISMHLGLAGKQTIVTEESLRDSYGVDSDKSLRRETGISLASVLQKEVVENVFLKSELNVFGSFADPDNPDVRLKNLVQMKINEYLNTSLELELFYDKDAWDGLQVRQTLGLGISATIL